MARQIIKPINKSVIDSVADNSGATAYAYNFRNPVVQSPPTQPLKSEGTVQKSKAKQSLSQSKKVEENAA